MAGRFILGAVNIDGASVFGSDILAQDFESALASEVSESDLNAIADRITSRYRKAGYVLSYAMLPQQSIKSGIVRIRVVEGYIGEVRISGAGRTEDRLKAIAAPLLTDKPLRAKTLERVVGLLRDVPGVVVSDVTISRSQDDPARHTLTITASHDPASGLVFADNRKTIDAAHGRLYASGSLNSVLTAGDQYQLDLFAIPGDGYRYLYGQFAASFPLSHDGLRLGLSASYGDQRQTFANLEFDGPSRNLAMQLSYPIVRSQALTAVARLSVNDWRSTGDFAGFLIQRDRLRAVRVSLDLTRVATTRIDAQISFSHSLDFAAGTQLGDPRASRPDASSHFGKVNVDVQITRPLSELITLRVSAVGQYATRPLLSVEEFALGGSRIGRAYDFNALTGDHGIGGSVELGYRISDPPIGLKQVELYGYADGGAVYQSGNASGLPHGQGLASLGGGARFSLFGISFSAELGVPLKKMNAGRSVRGFGSIAKAF